MNIKIGSKIHNRFDIEVRDKITGDLKQKGQAENIILDRIYTRLCNFNSYFSYIHFGQGTGTLDPSRELLFDELGYKSAETEETIKDFPVSKWTRKIVLNPEEYVGKSITEVGISDTYSSTKSKSYINTHALIKDAEGNQLTIEKTDTDVVIIYATVFIELQNRTENIRFTNLPNNNRLINYLCGGSFESPQIQLDESNRLSNTSLVTSLGSKTTARSINTNDRTVKFSTRFGITEGNGKIAGLGLEDIFACLLPEIHVFKSYDLQDVNIGIGDGVRTEFSIDDYNITNLLIKKDGQSANNYITENVEYDIFVKVPVSSSSTSNVCINASGEYFVLYRYYYSVNYFNIYYMPLDEHAMYYIGGISGWHSGVKAPTMTADGKYIFYAKQYYEIKNNRLYSIEVNDLPEEIEFNNLVEASGREITVIQSGLYGIRTNAGISKKVIFNTPPPEGAIITADYNVPYIPKTEDYVLDVTMEIQFGEGV